jgi:WD40 repeat protein
MSMRFCKYADSTAPRLARFALLALLCFLLAGWSANTRPASAGEVKIRQLTNDGRSYLEFGACAPAGSLVAYYRIIANNTTELCVLDLTSGKTTKVSEVGYPRSATWSPDGSRLAFVFSDSGEENSDSSLLIWNAASGKITRTGLRGQLYEFNVMWQPTRLYWSPDNSRILLHLSRQDSSVRLFVVPTDGSAAVEVAPNNPSGVLAEYGLPNMWSADSADFTFASWELGEIGQVWIADAKGRNLHSLTKKHPNLWSIARSWDGSRIAFTTSEGRLEEERKAGARDIWLMGADGSNIHPLAQGTASAVEERIYWRLFQWTRDNRYIMGDSIRKDQEENDRFYSLVFIDAGSGEIIPAYSFEYGTSEVFSAMRQWGDSWDGKRVAFIGTQYTVRGPRGGQQQYEERRTILKAFSIADRKMVDLLTYWADRDRKGLVNAPSWTPDCRQIVVTVMRIISEAEGKYEYDLYLVSVPWAEEAVKPPAPAEPTAAAQPSEPAPAQPAGPVEAVGIVELHVKHRRAAEAAELLPSAHEGTFTVDEGRNCLLVPAKAPNLQDLQLCLEAIDNSVPLIMVNVLVTELSKDANRQLGLDWEFARHRFGGLLPLGEDTTPGSVFWQGVGRLDDEFLGTLSALAQQGEAAVRANPRVLATSGKEASITIRRTDFFLYTSGTDYYGRPVRSRSDISADTILKITPILLADGRISVKVDATVDSFTFVGRDDLPDTTRRQAVTEVICSDGDSIVIGGLTQQEQSKTVHKTPLLGDLPVLGQLFRHTQRQSRESTLVIFITPHLSVPADRETTGSAELSPSP